MTQDLTSGSVSGALLLFSLPMILGNLLQQCYNLADTWIVGNFVGANALSAVGSAYALMTFLYSVLIGMCMGCASLFSYYTGARETERRDACALTSFVLLGGVSIAMSVVVQLLTDPILRLLRTPDELMGMMREYAVVIFLGIFFVFLYQYYAYLLRSLGDSATPLLFLGIASVLNIGLDLLFVLSFRWGIAGAAWATVLAQIVAGIGLLIFAWIKYPDLRFSWRRFRALKRKPFGEVLRFSVSASAQQSVMNFGILMVQGLVNSFGVSVMAAFAAGVKIDTLAYMPAQEFSNAYSIFLSQNHGAGRTDRICRGTRTAIMLTLLFCLAVSALVFWQARGLMGLFVSDAETEIIAIGGGYLRIEGAFYPLIGILFLLYGYFRGVNRPEISLLLTIVSLGLRVCLAYAAAGVLGVTGIWWSIPIGWCAADAVGLVLMRRHERKAV